MTLDELTEHTDNLAGLLVIKRRQLDHMPIDATARERHELAITALEGRVRELMRGIDRLRGDLPALETMRVRPGVPPLPGMSVKAKAVRDLASPPREI